MMKERILILFGSDSKLGWGRAYQLAKAFHELGHDVFYIDLPIPIHKSVFRNQGTVEEKDEFDVFQPKFGLPYARINGLRFFNYHLILRQVERVLSLNNFKPTIIWAYTLYEPRIAEILKNKLGSRYLIYDCAGDRVAMSRERLGDPASIMAKKLEEEIASICDVVFVESENLKERKKSLHKNIIVIPSGVDADMFSTERQLPRPEEYKHMQGKILLYAGTITVWVDTELIRQCALSYPEHSFAVVGPAIVDVSNLKGVKNIHLLGNRHYEDIPSFIKHADLCLIPFKETESLKCSKTMKALQYISMGKKVLSTYYDGVDDYGGVVNIAVSPEDFVQKIRGFLKNTQVDDLDNSLEIRNKYSWKGLAKDALEFIVQGDSHGLVNKANT